MSKQLLAFRLAYPCALSLGGASAERQFSRLKRLSGRQPKSSEPRASSHQLPSHHIQGHLSSEAADELAISGELPLYHLGSAIAGQGVKHETHRLFRASAGGPSDSRDANANSRFAAVTDAFGQSCRYLGTYGSMFFDHCCRYTGQLRLSVGRITECPRHK